MTKLRAQWDRAAAAVSTGLGAIFLIVGWFGASGTPSVAKQIPYMISGGIGGIFLLAVGGGLWLSADLRDQWRELRSLRIAQERQLAVTEATQEAVARDAALSERSSDEATPKATLKRVNGSRTRVATAARQSG